MVDINPPPCSHIIDANTKNKQNFFSFAGPPEVSKRIFEEGKKGFPKPNDYDFAQLVFSESFVSMRPSGRGVSLDTVRQICRAKTKPVNIMKQLEAR